MVGSPDLNESFTRSLATVSRQWTRHVDLQFRGLGLSQSRWRVLFELSRHQDVTQIELANSLGIEGATLVRLLDRLEADGLVERQPCVDDRRAKKLHLTDGTKPLIDKMKKIAVASRAELLGDVPPDDLRTATRVLSQIEARLELLRSDQNG